MDFSIFSGKKCSIPKKCPILQNTTKRGNALTSTVLEEILSYFLQKTLKIPKLSETTLYSCFWLIRYFFFDPTWFFFCPQQSVLYKSYAKKYDMLGNAFTKRVATNIKNVQIPSCRIFLESCGASDKDFFYIVSKSRKLTTLGQQNRWGGTITAICMKYRRLICRWVVSESFFAFNWFFCPISWCFT